MLYEIDAEWVHRAACRGMAVDVFFPAQGQSLAAARNTCKRCEVRMECLEHAMLQPEAVGIWGGLSERERRRIRQYRAGVRERDHGTVAS